MKDKIIEILEDEFLTTDLNRLKDKSSWYSRAATRIDSLYSECAKSAHTISEGEIEAYAIQFVEWSNPLPAIWTHHLYKQKLKLIETINEILSKSPKPVVSEIGIQQLWVKYRKSTDDIIKNGIMSFEGFKAAIKELNQ